MLSPGQQSQDTCFNPKRLMMQVADISVPFAGLWTILPTQLYALEVAEGDTAIHMIFLQRLAFLL
jgi:hypothetical protein